MAWPHIKLNKEELNHKVLCRDLHHPVSLVYGESVVEVVSGCVHKGVIHKRDNNQDYMVIFQDNNGSSELHLDQMGDQVHQNNNICRWILGSRKLQRQWHGWSGMVGAVWWWTRS